MDKVKNEQAPPAPEANKVSTPAERDTWSKEKVLRLERQHHKLDPNSASAEGGEVRRILEALRIHDGTLGAALNTKTGLLDPDTGNLALDVRRSGTRVGDKPVHLVEVFATGKETYDIRFLHVPLREEDCDKIPDEVYAGGAVILAWRKDVPMAWLFKTLGEMFNIDLTKPMQPMRTLRAILDDLNETFVKCECDECKAAVEAAEKNKTEPIDEKRKLLVAAGDHSWDDVWGKIDATRMLAETHEAVDMKSPEDVAKLKEALKRSLLVTAPAGKPN